MNCLEGMEGMKGIEGIDRMEGQYGTDRFRTDRIECGETSEKHEWKERSLYSPQRLRRR